MGVFGDTLRQARAHKGVTLREAEQATRISRHYLLALEEEHFDQLPALIYQRGIVKNYATYLDLDQQTLLRSFQEATGEPEPVMASMIGSGPSIEPAGGIVPNFAVIGFIVVMMAVIFAWGYSAYVASPGDVSLTQSPPTVTTVSLDDRFIPSPTRAVPTATRKADDAPTDSLNSSGPSGGAEEVAPGGEILLATLTATAEPAEITFGGGSGDDTASGDLSLDVENSDGVGELDTPVQDEAAADRKFSFYSETEVTLTVVVDNVVQWEGTLAAGSETAYLSGQDFLVTFSGADVITVVDGAGIQRKITGPTVELP